MPRTIDQMIASEVLCCMSSLVSTLALDFIGKDREAGQLIEQAEILAAPIDDWEEAAIQAGWHAQPDGTWSRNENKGERWQGADTAIIVCEEIEFIDPVQTEVFEHWAVTDWLADKLEAAGEKVDRDFAGLCVWARTTTGQQISADGVIQRVYAETHSP